MSPEEFVTVIIRLANAILWSAWAYKAWRGKFVTLLERRMVLIVIVPGMWALAFGGLAAVGIFDAGVARVIYTIFTAYAAMVALSLVIEHGEE